MARPPGEEFRIRQLERAIADKPSDASLHYELAKIYLAGEDWPAAIRILEKATNLDPTFTQANFELGIAYTRMRNWESAVREWEKMTDSDGELKLEGIDYNRHALVKAAIATWEQYETVAEESIFKHYYVGIAKLVLGKTLASVEAFTDVIKTNPTFEKALYYRSRAHRMLGNPREAGLDLQRMLEARPRDAIANYSVAVCLIEIGRQAQAITFLQKALNEKPGFLKAHVQLASAYYSMMQFDQAIEHLRKALHINPKDANAYYHLGRCFEKQYLMDEAAQAYENAVNYGADNKETHLSLGLLYKNLGRHSDAIKHLQKTVELDPEESDAYYYLGVLLSGLKKFADAIPPLQRCLELSPKNAFANYTLGKACLAVDRVAEAVQCFDRAMAENPNDVKTMTSLGLAYFQMQQFEEAKRQFENVLDKNPREAEAAYFLGATLFQQGDYDKAISSYQRAAQVNPDSALNHFTNGAIASYRKDYATALQLFRKATELRPDSEADLSKFATLQLLATVGINHAQTGLELEQFLEHKERLFESFVRALSSFLDARDRYTRYHSWRVAYIGKMLATFLGLPDVVVKGIWMGGFLHDVGKIGIPENVLNKPGKLTDEEYDLIKKHPVIGWEGLKGVDFPWPEVMPIVRYHHEKWNGKGYPDGLERDDIPFEAQIIGVADFFDALTTNRPYRKAFTYGEALKIMFDESGRFFNPDLLDEFARVVDTNEFMLGLPDPAKVDQETGEHILPTSDEMVAWDSLSASWDFQSLSL